jgi:hypothetical protein
MSKLRLSRGNPPQEKNAQSVAKASPIIGLVVWQIWFPISIVIDAQTVTMMSITKN